MNNAQLAPLKLGTLEHNHMKPSRLDDSLFSKDLAPHYMKLAGQLASSTMVPKAFQNKPQDLFICWAWGYQIGMTPEQAMQSIAVINGRPVMWGDELLALCMAHHEFVDIIETPIYKNDTVYGYSCVVKRKGKENKVGEFNLDMANRAGLIAKGGPWKQYPERMLKLRARAFALRDAFPDALKGIRSREEVEDYIEGEYSATDAKKSRAELLRNDFLTKKGSQDATEIEDKVPDVSIVSNGNNNEQDDSGNEAMEECISEVATILQDINEIIINKKIESKYIEAALEYYEVDDLSKLSKEAALDLWNRIRSI